MTFPQKTIYVTRDIERALGLPKETPNFFIVTNTSALAASRNDIYTIEHETTLDTYELLGHEKMKEIMTLHPGAHIMVFKNTQMIEKICANNNWPLLNPFAALAAQVEEKISQVAWLDELAAFLPPHYICKTKEIVWKGTPCILQYNRAHTGSGTHYIDSLDTLEILQQTFPERDARVTAFIPGPVITSNNIVTPTKTLRGNINYQITGLAPFTDNPFATIGNDWKLPSLLLSNKAAKQYDAIVDAIGTKLRASGWKGLFGIDVIYHIEEDILYLLEINARQPASTTYESMLQIGKYSNTHIGKISTFEAHVLSLFGESLDEYELLAIDTGAQILVRVPANGGRNKQRETYIVEEVTKLDCNVLVYTNDTPGSDWIRIQSTASFMHAHTTFNELGNNIKKIVDTQI